MPDNIIFAIIFAVVGVIPLAIAIWILHDVVKNWSSIEYEGPIPLPRGAYIGCAAGFLVTAIFLIAFAIALAMSLVAI